MSNIYLGFVRMRHCLYNFIECNNSVDDIRFTYTTDGYEIAV
jgi:hypothetical protein